MEGPGGRLTNRKEATSADPQVGDRLFHSFRYPRSRAVPGHLGQYRDRGDGACLGHVREDTGRSIEENKKEDRAVRGRDYASRTKEARAPLMMSGERHDLVLTIHLQSRGFAFVLFDGWLDLVDWGVYDARGADKNARCLDRIDSLLALHTPDVLILQDMSESGTRRARRIRDLNRDAAELADQCGMTVHMYSRAQVVEHFEELGATTKHGIAETIARRIPALHLYVPPARRPWMSEDARMGIFDATALAWRYFDTSDGRAPGDMH
jgi:hypothetical protein